MFGSARSTKTSTAVTQFDTYGLDTVSFGLSGYSFFGVEFHGAQIYGLGNDKVG